MARRKARVTVVRIPAGSLPEQEDFGTVTKGLRSCEASFACNRRPVRVGRRGARGARAHGRTGGAAARRAHARRADTAVQPRRDPLEGARYAVVPDAQHRGRWSAWQAGATTTGARRRLAQGERVWTGAADAIQIRKVGRVDRVREFLLWSPPVPTAERASSLRERRRSSRVRLACRRVDPARASPVRAGAEARSRPPHGHDQRVLVRALGVDRARHRGLPREGKRLGRHRLQLSRRRVRPGLRGPLRRYRQERRRRALAVGSTPARWVSRSSAPTGAPPRRRRHRTRSSSCSRGDSTSRTSTRSPRRLPLGRQREVSRGPDRAPARRLRAPRHLPHRVPGDALYRLLPAIAKRVAQSGGPKIYTPVVSGESAGPCASRRS